MKQNPKIIMLGDSNVGKTTILQTLINKQFPSKVGNTLGACYYNYDAKLTDGRMVSIDIWDTAGQQKYRSLLAVYFRNCDGIILVMDVSVPQTLSSIKYWATQISTNCTFTPAILLVANKSDLISNKEGVLHNKMVKLAEENRWDFIYCSAKQQYNVEEVFKRVGTQAEKVQRKRKAIDNNPSPFKSLKKSKRKTQQSSCC